ncbi:hypothetical protein ACSDQ9_12150 [Aestuariimicrobium soli]|uniref:hypothetical protein n=1 Tax=Aestuariimicrobium soli TaxID=2035834 RepID=UPI003EBC38C7
MVGTLVRLQLKLGWRSARRNVGVMIAIIIGYLYGLGFVAAALAGLTALRAQPVVLAGIVTTLGFGLVTLVWPLVTLLVAGMDQTLDPGRFALFPVRARQLMPGLLAASLTGVGALVTIALGIGQVITWSHSAGELVAAIVAMVIGVPTCVLLARTLASYFSSAFTQRKWRDVAAVILGLFGLTIGLAIQVLQRTVMEHVHDLTATLTPIARVVGWTPVAWAWSMPWEASQGAWLSVLVKLVLSSGFLVVLWRLWERQLDEALISPLTTGGYGSKVKANSWLDRLFPHTPAGAVAARSLRYWRRDPRHLMVVVSVVLMPILMATPILLNPELGGAARATTTLYPIGGMVMMAGLTVAAEIVYDGSALWGHIVSGLTGRDDRWGRVLAVSCILAPIALVLSVVFLLLSRQWALAPGLVGGTFGAAAAGVGVGSVVGAVWQYSAPPPGQNAFGKSSGGGLVGLLSTVVCMVASFVVSLPITVLTVISLDRPGFSWLVLLASVILGPLYVWAGVRWGGSILDKTWPEVLKRVTYEKT